MVGRGGFTKAGLIVIETRIMCDARTYDGDVTAVLVSYILHAQFILGSLPSML